MKTPLIRAAHILYKKRQPIITTALMMMVLLSYQNCQQQEFYEKEFLSEASGIDVKPNTGSPTLDDSTPSTPSGPLCQNGQNSAEVICNPLGGNEQNNSGEVSSKNGLIAHLYEGENAWNHLDNYFVNGYKHPEKIYFSNFNIPTRSFDEGFDFSDGDFLKNKEGNKLIEWFAIEANGFISAPTLEDEGDYHIMSLSDDGIEISLNEQPILSNKGIHAPTFDCAKNVVTLKKGEEKAFRLRYFQGPRYHISLMVFMKKIDKNLKEKIQVCPKVGNEKDLLTQGYKVINPEWFTLPKDM